MTVKYISVCDRCGKEWNQVNGPELQPVNVRGEGSRDLCPDCALDHTAIEDTIGRMKTKLLDNIVPEWFKGGDSPSRIMVSLYYPKREVPDEYGEIFVKG